MRWWWSLSAAGYLCAAVLAEPNGPVTDEAPASAASAAATDGKPNARPEPAITEHTLPLTEGELRYRATVGTLPLDNDAGERQADVFFVAYTLLTDGGGPDTGRPITFVFNGGPGAAAIWLHLGAVGPKVLELTADGDVPPPPHRLRPNPGSWLTATDLVLIDPVGTGFSRPAKGVDASQFYSVDGDIRAVGEFIRLYLTRYGRWSSPKFLAGESYGTTRAAGLSEHLLDEQGVALNGVMLVSTVLDFATIRLDENRPLPYALYVPTYVAAAHRHGRLPEAMQSRPLEEVLAEAEAWSVREYLPTLVLDDAAPGDARRATIERLAAYTGLPTSLIDRADLRVAPSLFQKELLAETGRIIGRFDSRLTGAATDPLRPYPTYDPSLSRYLPAYTAAFNAYVRDELGYETDLKYEVLTARVHPWDFGNAPGAGGFLDVSSRLRGAMVKQPAMRVFIASGRYDLATPYRATQYTIDNLDLPAELRGHLSHVVYDAGHMMYHEPESLRRLHADIAAFIADAAPGREGQPGKTE